MKKTNNTILNNQGGFTLIELIMVIVILGILAVVAIPKYADLAEEAEIAACKGEFGAAQGASAINFATNLISPSKSPAGGLILLGSDLIDAVDGFETADWTGGATTAISKTYSSGNCVITIDSVETSSNKAKLSVQALAP